MSNYNEALQGNNADLEAILETAKSLPSGAVLVTPQTLTPEQQAQARQNIGAFGGTEEELVQLTAMVLDALGGKVIPGYVDEDNNIVIVGLADGSYTVKYELEDGSTVEIGDLVLGADEPDVPETSYTNLAEPNPDNTTDFSIWCSNARLSGDGVVRAADGYTSTNYIALTAEDVIRVRGFKIERAGFYDAEKAALALGANDLAGHAANNYIYSDYSQTDDATTFTIRALTPAYVRLSGWVNTTADAVVITKNEEIT